MMYEILYAPVQTAGTLITMKNNFSLRTHYTLLAIAITLAIALASSFALFMNALRHAESARAPFAAGSQATTAALQILNAELWQTGFVFGVLLLLVIASFVVATRWYNANVQAVVQNLQATCAAAAKGDLTARASVRGPVELAQLAAQFNALLDARQAQDKARRQAQEKYRALVEHTPAVIYRAAVPRETSALYINLGISELLGYSPQEWMEQPALWCEHVHPHDRTSVLEKLHALRSADPPLVLEYRMYTRVGKLIWVRDQVRALSQMTGKPRILQGVMIDITALKMDDSMESNLDLSEKNWNPILVPLETPRDEPAAQAQTLSATESKRRML